MLRVILGRNGKAIALIVLVLSVTLFMNTTTAFGKAEKGSKVVEKLIKAKEGGIVKIAKGVIFRVDRSVVKEDTLIYAKMIQDENGLSFIFGPSGTTFFDPEYAAKMEELEADYQKLLDQLGLDNSYREELALLMASEQFFLILFQGPTDPFGFLGDYREEYEKELAKVEKDYRKKIERLEKQLEKGLDATLEIDRNVLKGIDDLTLYGSAVIYPHVVNKKKVMWKIPHFSVYYHRRR